MVYINNSLNNTANETFAVTKDCIIGAANKGNTLGYFESYHNNAAKWTDGTWMIPHIEAYDEGQTTASSVIALSSRTDNGGICRFALINVPTNNQAGSLVIAQGGFQAGNLSTIFTLDSTGAFTFRIPAGANPTIHHTAAGEVTMPLQPAFLAYKPGDTDNVTGDGTVYTLVFNTEVYDQNADYDGTSTFTAPVTGRYHFSSNFNVMILGAAHTAGYVGFITSNRNIYGFSINPYAMSNATQLVLSSSTYSDMDAGDTCYVTLAIAGGTKTVRSHGSADCITSFGGTLVC
jgi:hypothetical protein